MLTRKRLRDAMKLFLWDETIQRLKHDARISDLLNKLIIVADKLYESLPEEETASKGKKGQ